jgi:membrane protease YdiL (CAAX protease family)
VRRVRPKIWYVPALFTMPGLSVLVYLLMRALRLPLPPDPYIPLLPALAMCVGSLIAAVGEEGGWTGYAIDRMQDRRSALGAALLLGWWVRSGTSPCSCRSGARRPGSPGSRFL